MSTQLSIIVPVFNEEAVLSEFHQRITAVLDQLQLKSEIIFINDGSQDNSLNVLKSLQSSDPRVKFLNFSRNFGHQMAVHAGLDHCLGELIVVIDSDLQDPPELIPSLIEKHKDGFDVVYAQRRSRKGETPLKKATASLFYRILNRISDTSIPLDVGDFRLISRQVLEALKQMPERNKFIRGQISWLGFSQTAVLFDRDERKVGTTGYSLKKQLQLALNGISGFSNFPLKLVTWMGIGVSIISLVVILYSLFAHFFMSNTITGWTSLIVTISFFSGVQLLAIGIIGTYLSRINNDVRQRPLYVISEMGTDLKSAEKEAQKTPEFNTVNKS